ncbi:MAG: hypothetical protein ACK5KP_06545 [Paludibacteraceae bacterium]
MKIFLQSIISPPLLLRVLTYLVFFGVSAGCYSVYDFPITMPGAVGKYAESILPSSSLIANVITCSLVILNSMIIAQINNRYAIIRTRTFMPTFIYLLLSASWLPAYGNYIAVLAASFVLLAVYIMPGMYKEKGSVEQAFLVFIFLGVASFLVNEFVVLVLIFWIGFFLLHSFSTRVFFASILGFSVPWIFWIAISCFFFDGIEFIFDYQQIEMDLTVFDSKNTSAFLYAGAMLAILIIAFVQISTNYRQISIESRRIFLFFRVLIITLLLLMSFHFIGFSSYMPLLAIFYALVTAYVFTLLKNMFNSVVFTVLCVLNLVFASYLLIIQSI